jgi:hypothetical protein
MGNLVYRAGSRSDDNFTPRPDMDLQDRPGQSAGLSTFTALELAVQPGGKAQIIDLDRLEPPLRGFPDDPRLEGGVEGHVSIAPAAGDGRVDSRSLAEWAATRGTSHKHPLTELALRARVGEVKRPR